MPELKDFNKNIVVVKRDGREESFSKKKLKRLSLWATDGNDVLAERLVEDTSIKISNRVRSSTILRSLIQTASNNISLITPEWQFVAARLFLLEKYHSLHLGVDFRNGEYPHIETVLSSSIYKNDFLSSYSKEELDVANAFIEPDRDYKFTYSGLYYMFNKYCKGKELPQHTYLRVALALMRKEKPSERLELVKRLYDALSLHKITLATPVLINSGMQNEQLSSCILMKTDDSLESIMETAYNEAIYSKYAGGIAIDITSLRARGSKVKGNNGFSGGPVGFIKIYESVIKNVAQSGVRVGSAVITFDWWHPDFMEMVALRRDDGNDENRARHLKYAVRINSYLLKAVEEGRDVKLVNPASSPKLATTWGEEWECLYENAPAAKILPAKEVMYEIMRSMVETGNMYLFFVDNVNEQNVIKDRFVNSSNLCMEIVQPSSPGSEKKSKLIREYGSSDVKEIVEHIPPEISLCTLGSIDISHFDNAPEEEKREIANIIVRALDNSFDIADFPVKGAEVTSKEYRYIGVGILNYAKMIAQWGLRFDDDETYERVEKVMADFERFTTEASVKLAEERGAYPAWKPSHGQRRRNALIRSIAPTASSGRAINATESIEPPRNLFQRLEATINLPWIVPDFRKLGRYYQTSFEVGSEVLLKHAAIRQKYLDQSQSVSLFLGDEEKHSARKLFELIKKAHDMGIKTIYYTHTKKKGQDEICESCS